MKRLLVVDRYLASLLLIVVGYSLWGSFLGFHHSITDLHQFRQTQTALSTYYYESWPSNWRYWTPVLGPPWSIPFELPLYQTFVAMLWQQSGMGLDQAGRSVSLLSYGLGLCCLLWICTRLGLTKRTRIIVIILTLTSPQYLFWSRTFMIEPFTNLLCLLFLACVLEHLTTGQYRWLAAASFWGVLGALVKITTFYGFAVVAAIIVLWHWSKEDSPFQKKIVALQVLRGTLLAAIPLAAITMWTNFADLQKAANPLAVDFITSNALSKWNFGTWEQKLSLQSLQRFLGVTVRDCLGHTADLYLFILLAWFAGRQARWAMAFGVIAFFIPLYTFTNLHLQHSYYSYANGLFLIVGCATVLGTLFQEQQIPDPGAKKRLVIAGILLLLTVISNVKSYLDHHYKAQRVDHQRFGAEVHWLQEKTDRDDILLIWGLDWEPELPYLAGRRAAMWYGNFEILGPRSKGLRRELNQEKGNLIAAFCGATRDLAAYQEDFAKCWDITFGEVFEGPRCKLIQLNKTPSWQL